MTAIAIVRMWQRDPGAAIGQRPGPAAGLAARAPVRYFGKGCWIAARAEGAPADSHGVGTSGDLFSRRYPERFFRSLRRLRRRIPRLQNGPKITLARGGGGGRGIRTPGRLAPTTVFKTVAINRSAIPPTCLRRRRAVRRKIGAKTIVHRNDYLLRSNTWLGTDFKFQDRCLKPLGHPSCSRISTA
jgi:hypothetical protein